MPERPERLLWVYGKSVDKVRPDLEAALQSIAAAWSECPVTLDVCVDAPASTDRLWLFRLQHGVGNNGVAERFNGKLAEGIEETKARLGLGGDQLKRRPNFPTPVVQPTPHEWPRTDVGLHPVNDIYNGMLVTFSYNEGRYLHPPHMQLVTLRAVMSTVQKAWAAFACGCRDATPTCCDREGCYDCFLLDCSDCEGTGWKQYVRWKAGGSKVDYSQRFHATKRYPVAVI